MTDEFIGQNIGGYEVRALIGQGGMARVYLARQQSMNRQVALKVLPRQFMSDDTYLQRFEREVKIVSQLEHRNIIPVYDYGTYDGQPYIVMRYMPSGSVDDMLHREGPLPPEKILHVLGQIAPALDYAHSKDVLHRDLKPSNVLMDDDGGAFITDFGIARVTGEVGPAITTQGVVGTPSYMSPEQAQGKPLDGRSDLYSLGVMLFEVSTGRRPFEAETAYSIAVMQVTTPPPPPRSLNPALSTAIESVILKALRKHPDERYPTAAALYEAFKLAIERPLAVYDTEPNFKTAVASQPNPPSPPPVVIAPPSVAPPISASPQQPVAPVYPSQSVRPVTRRKRSSAWPNMLLGGALGCGMLLVVALVALLAISFLISSLGATANGANGSMTAPVTEDAAFTLDPTSEAARETLVAIDQVNAEATRAMQTRAALLPSPTRLDPVGVRASPTLAAELEDARGTLVYTARRGEPPRFQIVALDLATGLETLLTQDDSDNSYPIPSPDGQWIAFQSNRDGDFDIYVMDRQGRSLRAISRNSVFDRLPAWSPDGEWIIYSSDTRGDGTFDLVRTRLDGSETEIVYSNGQRLSHPRYSPDGTAIVFTLGPDPGDARTWEIARLDLATGTVALLTQNSARDASPAWSPDGSRILYVTQTDRDNAIAIMNPDGSESRIIHDSSGSDWSAAFSPDGRFIVVTSDASGRDELYLLRLDTEVVQQLTFTGASSAQWIP